MIEFIAKIAGMSQKYSVDKDQNRHVHLNLKLEIKDGLDAIPDLSEYLGEALEIKMEPVQPGLIPKKK